MSEYLGSTSSEDWAEVENNFTDSARHCLSHWQKGPSPLKSGNFFGVSLVLVRSSRLNDMVKQKSQEAIS